MRKGTAVGLAAAVVVPCPLLMAGEPAWALQLIAAIVFVGLSLSVAHQRRSVRLFEADYAVLACLVWTSLQLVPAPASWAPNVVSRGYALAGLGGLIPSSIDPAATREKLLVVGVAVGAWAVGRLVSRAAGARAVIVVVAASTTVVAVVSFGHEVVNAHRVFGLYTPIDAHPALMSPILNSNQLGGFLAFGSVLWLGLAASSRERHFVLLSSTFALLCALGALGSGSRGAALSLGLGFAWTLTVVLRRRSRGIARRIVVVFGVAGIAMSVFAVIGLAQLVQGITGGDYSKLELIREASFLAFDQPLRGVGRGAFEAAFAQGGRADLRFTHPENFAVQWVVEWGIPFALIMFGVWTRFLARGGRHERAHIAIAAGAACAFLAHDLFDFALEMPGILVVFMVLLSALATGPSTQRRLPFRGQIALCGVLIFVALVGGIGGGERRTSSYAERALEVESENLDAFMEDAVREHPVDPIAALAVAIALTNNDDPRSLRWVNRTLELAPNWSAPHDLAARILARRGAYAQSLLEAFEAERRRRNQTLDLVCWLAPRVPRRHLVDIARVRESDPNLATARRGFVDRITRCLEAPQRTLFDEELIAAHGSVDALLRRASSRLSAQNAAGAFEDLDRIGPEFHDLRYLLLRARTVADLQTPTNGLAVLSVLNAEMLNDRGRWRLNETRAELYGAAGDDDGLESVLSALRRSGAGDAEVIARAWAVGGRVYRSNQRAGAATSAFLRAHRLDQENSTYLWALANLARSQGFSRARAGYLRTLCRQGEDRACER